MKMRFGMIVGSALAVKYHEKLPEHVEGRHPGGDQTDTPECRRAVAKGLP